MLNLTFIIGQIRAWEDQLLTQNQIERMVGSPTPLDAFHVFIELPYAEYIDESTTPNNFEQIIRQGLLETKHSLVKGTNDHSALHILWGQFDMNNLKKAYKDKILLEKPNIEHFDENHGYSELGILTHHQIQDIVWNHILPEFIPDSLQDAISHIQQYVFAHTEMNNKESYINGIEHVINQSFFHYFQNKAPQKNAFVSQWVRFLIDRSNLMMMARSVFMRQKKLSSKEYIEGGSIPYSELESIHSQAQAIECIKRSELGFQAHIELQENTQESIMQIEKELDRCLYQFIDEGQGGLIDDIQVPISYFSRRIRNAQKIKCIMFSKYNGLTEKQIYTLLQSFS